jgi:uncharacterized protein (DUF302 family)
MIQQTTPYGLGTTIALPYEQAVERTRQALTAERDIGLLLPCNVVVYAADEPGKSVVAVLDPVKALSLTGNDTIQPLASEVRSRLERVLASLETA